MRISRLNIDGKEILVADFSSCKEYQMIEIIDDLRSLLIKQGKLQLVLAIFNEKNYLTPKFMRHFETQRMEEASHFIQKVAVFKFNNVKKSILKGFNMFFDRDIKAFDSREAAIKYLIHDAN